MNFEEDLIVYIGEQMMQGQAHDLDATTPLLELNIIDSVGLVMLTTHVSENYGVKIPVNLLTPENLKDVKSIAQLVLQLQTSGENGQRT